MTFRRLKGLYKIVLIVGKINWIQFFRRYDNRSKNILWIPPKKLAYFFSDSIIWDAATVNALIGCGMSFKIVYGFKIGELTRKNIFHTVNNAVNVFKFSNYTDVYEHLMSQLERQENALFPNSYEVRFWENKAYMYEQFKQLNIPTPLTILLPLNEHIDTSNFTYPFLVKSEHSCSSKGLHKISNEEDFKSLISSTKFKLENNVVVKQELINMRRDLRVTIVGNEIVHHYWRINNNAEWQPTSTSYGSGVDFGNFPVKWTNHILDTFKKLKFSAGAFDITWEDDNLDKEPLYLEVSPVFQPNPPIELKGKQYAHYKKKFSFTNPFDKAYVELIFSIKLKLLRYNLTSDNLEHE